MTESNRHWGASLNDFLDREGIRDEVRAETLQRIGWPVVPYPARDPSIESLSIGHELVNPEAKKFCDRYEARVLGSFPAKTIVSRELIEDAAPGFWINADLENGTLTLSFKNGRATYAVIATTVYGDWIVTLTSSEMLTQ